jgi:hypothetical protein
MNIAYVEPWIAERIEAAKQAARDVLDAKRIETDEDAIAVMRALLSLHYKMPYYSEFFDNLTFDQYVFELELASGRLVPTPEQKAAEGQKMLQENAAEVVDGVFGDWIEQDMSPPAVAPPGVPDPFDQMSKDFFESGDFVNKPGEKK